MFLISQKSQDLTSSGENEDGRKTDKRRDTLSYFYMSGRVDVTPGSHMFDVNLRETNYR